jgi:glycosyltransferase involved in cell wall biosynthesis
MRILVFNWRDPTHPWAGGAEVFLYEVARRWVRWGHSVTWLCGHHEGQPAQGQIEGIDVVRRGGIYSVYPAAALYYLSRLRGRFDVMLDSANGIPFFTPLFSATPKMALVHHIHGEVFFCELPRHLACLGNTLERVGMPLVYCRTAFIAVSESSRQALVDIGIPAGRISVIHNGVDASRYRPGTKSPAPLLVLVGRLRRYKSIDVAIRALPDLLRAVPGLRLSIVGSGPMAGALRHLAEELGVAEAVCFHGFVAEAVKVRLLQQAHLVINTSMKEGWGLTVLEANACGTPVVAANVPGLRDSVQDGETGLLVPHGDPGALAREVRALLLDDDRREQMARKAVAWAARFDWDQTARSCLDLLIHCLEERERR